MLTAWVAYKEGMVSASNRMLSMAIYRSSSSVQQCSNVVRIVCRDFRSIAIYFSTAPAASKCRTNYILPVLSVHAPPRPALAIPA